MNYYQWLLEVFKLAESFSVDITPLRGEEDSFETFFLAQWKELKSPPAALTEFVKRFREDW